jgi:hypothetical protein
MVPAHHHHHHRQVLCRHHRRNGKARLLLTEPTPLAGPASLIVGVTANHPYVYLRLAFCDKQQTENVLNAVAQDHDPDLSDFSVDLVADSASRPFKSAFSFSRTWTYCQPPTTPMDAFEPSIRTSSENHLPS